MNEKGSWLRLRYDTVEFLQQSSSVLDMGTNPKPGEYEACAEGESATCYKGNISDLCSRLTSK
ncbi:hypothetical protein CHS0354_009661 [Potamilus streckersoni]|uniref:Uncharacterized protein n=1 Tax=Potamilus streckersoni TaxID=2493646 RepID=A0AAE0VQ76_9BIVA|nr:hypothetical protein CHS0354_009661 [Potamilus streckersoni]